MSLWYAKVLLHELGVYIDCIQPAFASCTISRRENKHEEQNTRNSSFLVRRQALCVYKKEVIILGVVANAEFRTFYPGRNLIIIVTYFTCVYLMN